MADIKYTVVVDSAGATSSVQRFDQALKDTEKTTERAEGGFGKLWKQMAVGQIVGQAVTQIFRAITREMMSVVTAAEAQESADNALASALELTGRAIPLSQMKEFASQMQAMTRFGDEEVQSAQTLLVQMTNLDKDGLERATKGAIGLASVMRMDLFSATSLVQKALSGNIGALSRYGISVDATLTKDEQRAQLMDKLSVLFGRAEAETDTFAVKITQLKNAYGDMKESIGAAIINNQAFKDLIQGITEKIQTLITSGKLDEWATKISAAITVAIKTLESFFDLVDNLSKGKSIGQTVADQIFGVKGDIAARTADAIAEMNRFAGSLTTLKPQFNDMKVNMEAGAENWKAYTKRVAELDAQLTKERALPPYVAKVGAATEAVKKFLDKLSGGRVVVDLFEQNLSNLADQFQEMRDAGTDIFPEEGTSALQTLLDTALSGEGIPKVTEEITGMEGVWNTAMGNMLSSAVLFTSSVGDVFSSFIKTTISGMETMYFRQIMISKGIMKAKQGEATASHISNIFKSVPFPLDIILAAGAFAVVNALFSKLMKFEKGGVFDKPTLAMFGEGREKEYALPESKLVNLIRAAVTGRPVGTAPAPAMAMAGGMGGTTVNLYGPLLSVRELSDSNIRTAGDKLYAEVQRQAKRLGR